MSADKKGEDRGILASDEKHPDYAVGDVHTTSRRKNHYALTLYVVATDAHGKKATKARVFATSAGYYVGMDRILNGTAF